MPGGSGATAFEIALRNSGGVYADRPATNFCPRRNNRSAGMALGLPVLAPQHAAHVETKHGQPKGMAVLRARHRNKAASPNSGAMATAPGRGRRSGPCRRGLSRRQLALASLLGRDGLLASSMPEGNPLAPRQPHYRPRAKNVIFLFMSGGPSHVDLFDPKPDLLRLAGQPIP